MTTDRISLFCPDLSDRHLDAVRDVMVSGWLGYGPRCLSAETQWAATVNARFGVATNSCTSALMIALRLRDIGPGDEVIVPTITFAATAEAVSAVGATPVLCDVHPDTLLIDLNSAASLLTNRTRAIIPVLYAGRHFDIGTTWQGLHVIYDCAHAGGLRMNAAGRTCCWSFQAVKNLGCGDGGMLTLDDEQEQLRAKSLAWHGISRSTWDRAQTRHYTWEYDVRESGFKAQMNDLTAAILLENIATIDNTRLQRQALAALYRLRLRHCPGVTILNDDLSLDQSSWHLFVIKVSPCQRNALAEYLDQHGVVTGVHYRPLHLHTLFGNGGQSLPVAESEWLRLLSLPFHTRLAAEQVHHVCDLIHEFQSRAERIAA